MKRTVLLLLFLTYWSIFTSAQTASTVFIGASVPDNISDRYLIPGAYISYGRNFKILEKVLLNAEFSASYNSKNRDYRFGYDDNPEYNQSFDKINGEIMCRHVGFNPYEKTQLYVFSPSLGINLEYSPLYGKSDSPYLKVGVSLNYSFTEDIVDIFVPIEESEEWERIRTGGKESGFKIGFSGGFGVEFKTKHTKTFFIETEYKIFPSILLGSYDDRVGLFIIKAGMGF